MVWFFHRSGQDMRVVTRFDRRSEEYVLEVHWADRPPEHERFASFEAFNQRVQALQAELTGNRWMQSGPPALLAHGWRGPGPET